MTQFSVTAIRHLKKRLEDPMQAPVGVFHDFLTLLENAFHDQQIPEPTPGMAKAHKVLERAPLDVGLESHKSQQVTLTVTFAYTEAPRRPPISVLIARIKAVFRYVGITATVEKQEWPPKS